MKLLLTGADGFIGTAFRSLAQKQGHDVLCLTRPESAGESLLGITRLEGTLLEPPWQEIEKFGADAVVHSAWITTPGAYLESPENARLATDSEHFLLGCLNVGIRQVFALGSCIEYAPCGEPLPEGYATSTPSQYARSKAQLRSALRSAKSERSFCLTWGRIFYPYGPGEHSNRLCTWLFRELSQSRQVILKTPDSLRDYIYIDDLASAMLHALELRFDGDLNLGTGKGVSVFDIATIVAKILHQEGLIQPSSLPVPDPTPVIVADASRLRGLGWSPCVSLPEGLERLRRRLFP